jgi:hypothetical protein
MADDGIRTTLRDAALWYLLHTRSRHRKRPPDL